MTTQIENRHVCNHLLQTGKSKGKKCGKPSAYEIAISQDIGYCRNHQAKYLGEINTYVTEVLRLRTENANKERREYENKLESRELNVSKFRTLANAVAKKSGRGGDGELLDIYLFQAEPEFELVEAVDKMLFNLISGFQSFRPTHMVLNFTIYPYQTYGHTFNDVATELEKRGFMVGKGGVEPVQYLLVNIGYL
uniref:Uncharacterized protein n=1 Tax=viral metagenome TaxID=1070528 RepID=A0A6C0ELK0_9ZZZZ